MWLLPIAAAAQTPGELHVPSPDWRDAVIYFVMIDRFADGDPSNNDQGKGEYDPRDHRRYSGGDLRGVQQQLDYIQGLGATAVWITPPVANQWWNPDTRYGGYHGYWATDFSKVDAHYGTLADYQALSRALHGRGMSLVQDIVVNHTANFIRYSSRWKAFDPARGFSLITDTQGQQSPTQAPFDRNDARDPAQRSEAIYHWTPDITDYEIREQYVNWQLAGLDDLNTESPAVRKAMRKTYGDWIRAVGVDAFRVDTALHVPEGFFEDFMHADDADAPGIAAVARQTGRDNFIAFGEAFQVDKAFEDTQARRIEAYASKATDGTPRLDSLLNFSLYGATLEVFAKQQPTAELAWRIDNMMQVHARPHLMPSFVDNHDVDRFLATGDEAALKQALLAIMTLPGIPVIYYGTEQGFDKRRPAMFASGVDADGRDHYDTQAPLYRYLHDAIALRRSQPVLSRGTPRVLASNAQAPGVLAYAMQHEGRQLLVAFNTADKAQTLTLPAGSFTADARLHSVFAIHGATPDRTTD
ncbi:MAG: alpha-amylase family glycosyl hydrolase, partial [Pseudoxanthomonas sp.]